MTHFQYKGTSRSGAEVTGIVEAYDRYDAVAKIRQECPVVQEVREVSGRDIGEIFPVRKVNLKALSLLCNQFAIILGAGLPLVRCVELVAGQVTDRTLRRILRDVAGDVAAGSPLSDAFEKRGPMLPVTFIESLRAGEQSGGLDAAFARLSRFYSKTAKTRQKTTSALIYPVFVIVVAIVVIAVIMAFAIPQIKTAFDDLGTELPLLTRIMIGLSDFMAACWPYLLAVILAAVLFCRIWGRTENGRLRLARLALRLPVTGKITELSNCAQFSATMSAMVAAGIPILRSVGVAGRAMGNYAMSRGIQQTAAGLEAGRRLADCMKECEYLPPLLVEMTAVGEETGALEHTLEVIGDYYDNETDVATARALSLLEPTLIIVLAVFVLLVLLAVYVPIFSMYGAIR